MLMSTAKDDMLSTAPFAYELGLVSAGDVFLVDMRHRMPTLVTIDTVGAVEPDDGEIILHEENVIAYLTTFCCGMVGYRRHGDIFVRDLVSPSWRAATCDTVSVHQWTRMCERGEIHPIHHLDDDYLIRLGFSKRHV